MAQPYNFSKANDTLNGTVDPAKLWQQIIAQAYGKTLLNVGDDADNLEVKFDADLIAAEKTSLDGILSAHDGLPLTKYTFISSQSMVQAQVSVTDNATFGNYGIPVPTKPESFGPLNLVKARVTADLKTDGTGSEIRITEMNIDGTFNKSLSVSAYSIGDTSNVWTRIKFWTDVDPSAGDWTYCLQARYNGATSFDIKDNPQLEC